MILWSRAKDSHLWYIRDSIFFFIRRNSNEIESFLQERKKNINVSEKKFIVEELKKYRRSNSAREFLFEDRTRPHADQAWGNSFEATAAVGECCKYDLDFSNLHSMS